jgi:L-lactate dehydrogenase complex protein LldG
MATRAEFLGRIRAEVGQDAGPLRGADRDPPAATSGGRAGRAAADGRALAGGPRALSQEFEQVAGVFHRVKTVAEVPAAVLAIAREKSAREVVTWDAAMLGLDLRPRLAPRGSRSGTVAPGDNGEAARLRHRAEAARADLGVTGVDFALAETGTMILLSGAGRPRSTSLLPATHVAVFDRRRLIESLEQVGIMLEALHVDPARTMSGAVINFITGPSRTADIELTLTRGVHGPKEVHAVFVDEPLGAEGPA